MSGFKFNQVILSLYDATGNISEPWREAGYEVRQFDMAKDGMDLRLIKREPWMERVVGILAQPPCTHFAGSGSRWWAGKGDAALVEGLSCVDVIFRLKALCQPRWWVLENPVGRLNDYIGKPRIYVDPYRYAHLADEPEEEMYTKRTGLWGDFPALALRALEDPEAVPTLGSKMHLLPPGPDRAAKRSVTPQGVARALYLAISGEEKLP